MSKSSAAMERLPPVVVRALERLGEDLSLARIRRRESQRVWAKRLGVSVPTVIRLEKGDPGVGLGILATALWMIGRVDSLASLADPTQDLGALERDIRKAQTRRAARAPERKR